MEKRKIEYRYYEIPEGHYCLCMLGEAWERYYAPEVKDMLHFHNYLEIGYNYWGNGVVTVDDLDISYKGAVCTLIPRNIPHSTVTEDNKIDKWEFLFVDLDSFIRNEMSFKRTPNDDVIKKLNKQAYVIHWSENRRLTTIIKCILEEYREKNPFYKEAVKGYLRALVIEMLRISDEMLTSTTVDEKRVNNYIKLGVDYISEHYAEEIKMVDMASECGLSESHFRRLFGETMGMKPWDYVNMVRINKACEMLINEDIAMEEIGYRVGFQNTSTFTRNFKKLTGTTPFQWKKDQKNSENTIKNFKISAKKGW